MAAAVPDLTPILASAQSPDAATRQAAEAALAAARAANPPGFLAALAAELGGEGRPPETRQIAGIILKNALDAPNDVKKAELAEQWKALDGGVKAQIRASLLGTLGSQVHAAAHTAALVTAKVAAIDLPARAWPELVPALLQTMAAQPPAPAPLRTATLEALGYVCEEMAKLEEDVLEQATVNSVLTAVVAGMRAPAPADGASAGDESAVRLAATRALYNALEFAATNFDNADERNFLMQCVCEAACAPRDARVRAAALECLVKIAAAHYDKLPPYMQDLFALTHRAVTSDEEDVAKQALEFWCTVADEEIDAADAAAAGDAAAVNHRFIAQALAPLTALLLDQLVKQEEGQDTDGGAWNVCMAAGTALGLAARAAGGDAILPLVSPYVSAGLARPDDAPEAWRAREAAAFALGSVVDGPPPRALAPLAGAALPRLLACLRDPSSQVRHTAAWAVGRVFEFVGAALPLAGAADACVGPLLQSTQDEPHVADKACYALSQLAAAAADAADDAAASATSGAGAAAAGAGALPARAVQEIVAALFALADRCAPLPDAAAGRAAASAYEAINEVVRCSPPDAVPLVGALIPATLAKLAAALRADAAAADARARRGELVALLCGVLTVALQRLASDDAVGRSVAAGHADAVMEAVLAVLNDARATGDTGAATEEALLTAGALTFAAGPRFAAYLPAFAPALDAALARPDDAAACTVAVGVLGDVARAVDAALAPYAPRFVSTLLTALRSPDVRREVKPPILSAFGDVALALGPGFTPLAAEVVPTLAAAASLAAAAAAAAAPDDEDALDYTDALRSGVAEAYSGLFNGLAAGAGAATPPDAAAALAAAGPAALDFAADVAARADGADPSVVKAVVSLVGDVAAAVPGAGAAVAARATLAQFLRAATGAQDAELASAAKWAVSAVASSGG